MKAFLILILATSALAAITLRNERSAIKLDGPQQSITKPEGDYCTDCVDFFTQFMPQLDQIISEGGVFTSCEDFCTFFNTQPANMYCNLVCDIVGVRAFVDLLNETDPNPVYLCQETTFCPQVANGAVQVVGASITPTSGTRGQIFTAWLNYTVTSPTGPGYQVLLIRTVANTTQSVEYAVFSEGQSVGTYALPWEFQATPSEQESFDKGTYVAGMAICAGDCSDDHEYSGVYADAAVTFQVTDN